MKRTKPNFVTAVASSSTTIDAPLEWHVPRPLPCVAPPRLVAAPRNQQPFRFDPHAFDRDFRHIDDGV